MLLLHYFCKHVNPSAVVGSSLLKDNLESKNLAEFSQDLKQCHAWLEDCKSQIDAEEGVDSYKEYLGYIFRTYKTSTHKEFHKEIKEEKRNWVNGKLRTKKSYHDLVKNGLLLSNNEDSGGMWEYT